MKKKRLLIVHCSTFGATETFIRNHVERLPYETTLVHELPPSVVHLDRYAPGEGKAVDALEDHTAPYSALIEELEPDVVLAEYGPSGVSVLEACKNKGIPLVVHFHGFDCSMTKVVERYVERYQEMFHYASTIVSPSEAMGKRLAELGAPIEKLQTISYGVDLSSFPYTPCPNNKRALFVGRLVEKKAPLQLLDAFSEALKQVPDLRLSMAGDGPLRPLCEEKIKQHGIADSVELLGAVKHREISELLKSSLFLTCPSRTALNGDEEGLPNCILEAFASGRAVIGTAHAGIPEVVLNEETGLLVNPIDMSALTEAFVRLATDLTFTERLGKAARKLAEEQYSLDGQLNKLSQVIQSV